MNKLGILSFLFFLSIVSYAQGYLHRDGDRIVDGRGNNVLLRGLGLGGWMIQEGYMLKTGSFAPTQREIRAAIEDMIGEKATDEFYAAYLENGITRRDIDSLAAWGFNSVRLPMHYNLFTPPIEQEKGEAITFIQKGFEMTDALLEWCAENEIYLILDMHAAPGGQGKNASISDYDPEKPSLWESQANRNKLVTLWRELANRYKEEPWIGGYDIINEPNWAFTGENENGCDEVSNAPLRELMMDITKAIREVDRNHIIFIEGNCWGNNYEGVFPLWDDNLVISFHKYWNENTTASIQKFLDYRDALGVPVWLGESGENSNVWFRDAIRLVEGHNIGWAFWPMKKIDNIAGIASVTLNPGYSNLLDYWNKKGDRPEREAARRALMQLAGDYSMERVTVKPDVIDAMFRQVYSDETLAYSKHVIPGRIYATEYDLGSQGFAYSDTEFANTGKGKGWNSGFSMRNDGVDIQACTDIPSNGYEVFDIQDGEWLLFTTDIKLAGTYDVAIRYTSPERAGRLHLESNNKKISESMALPVTAKEAGYAEVVLRNVSLNTGKQKIKVVFDTGGFQLNYLEFRPASGN